MSDTQFYYEVVEKNTVRDSIVFFLYWYSPNFHLGPSMRGQIYKTTISDFEERCESENWKPYEGTVI